MRDSAESGIGRRARLRECIRDIGGVAPGGMAPIARHGTMGPPKRVLGSIVIESRGRFPGDRGVAARAIPGELRAVFVEMTAGACPIEAEKGFAARVAVDPDANVVLPDPARVVTTSTRELRVRPLEDVAGLRVIERRLRWLPANETEIPTRMFVVAGLAWRARHILRRVIARAGADPRAERLVAGEAAIGGDLALAEFVALGAVLDPLEIGVRLRERARGDGLRRRCGGTETRENRRARAFRGRIAPSRGSSLASEDPSVPEREAHGDVNDDDDDEEQGKQGVPDLQWSGGA